MDEERYLPEKDNYIVNSSEFDRVKARLLSIDNAIKADSQAAAVDQKRPTLKRRTDTNDPNGTNTGTQNPQNRPTLKKAGDPTDPVKK
jgi:hypothetical protein